MTFVVVVVVLLCGALCLQRWGRRRRIDPPLSQAWIRAHRASYDGDKL
jgi:hypothetical protein